VTNAWWDRGDRRTTRVQIAVRASAAFAAVALTLAISWPVGIGLAIVVCAIATVTANRMLQAGEQADAVVDLAALLG
jgi:hypothetical protein